MVVSFAVSPCVFDEGQVFVDEAFWHSTGEGDLVSGELLREEPDPIEDR